MNKYELRYYQEEAVRATYKYIKDGGRAGVAVLPTATGKSIVIAELIKRTLLARNHVRVMMLTHVKELIGQNHEKLRSIWPTAPCGIFSAGLKAKQHTYPITYAGIQSCYRHPKLFGHIDMVIIDECHLISDKSESMYGSFLKGLKEVNPNIVIIGFTATPYRLGMGYLTEGPIFDDIYYDISTLDDFVKLIDEGYLCDLVPVRAEAEFDLTEVKKIAGEFSETSLDENINREEITKAVVAETVMRAKDRNKGIAFCISISHAESMSDLFNQAGLRSTVIHSQLEGNLRDERIADYRKGKYNMLCNVGVLTTGFDDPEIDYLVIARPTESTSLHVQIMGRGMRPHPSKKNTLVLDFAGNTIRLGPVNDPVIPVKKGEGKGDPPIRICPKCETINHASARTCKFCGHEFPPPEIKIAEKAYSVELIKRTELPKIYEQPVDKVIWNIHNSRANNQVLKMTFICGKNFYDVFFTFDKNSTKGYGASVSKWRKLGYSIVPDNVQDAITLLNEGFTCPDRVKVWANKPVEGFGGAKKRKEIMDFIYEAK